MACICKRHTELEKLLPSFCWPENAYCWNYICNVHGCINAAATPSKKWVFCFYCIQTYWTKLIHLNSINYVILCCCTYIIKICLLGKIKIKIKNPCQIYRYYTMSREIDRWLMVFRLSLLLLFIIKLIGIKYTDWFFGFRILLFVLLRSNMKLAFPTKSINFTLKIDR